MRAFNEAVGTRLNRKVDAHAACCPTAHLVTSLPAVEGALPNIPLW